MVTSQRKVCDAGETGPKGEGATERSEPIPTASAGKKGSAHSMLLSQYQNLPVAPPLSWLAQYLHTAEIDYINQQEEVCLEKLSWIAQLVDLSNRSDIDTINPDSFHVIRQKVAALTDSIDKGLDAFGSDRNYVPLTSYSFLRDNAERIIDHARHIEAEHQALSDDLEQQNTNRIAAQRAIENTRQALKRKGQLVGKRFAEITELQHRSEELFVELEASWSELNEAAGNFKQAVTRKAGCEFEHVVQFGMMVCTVVSTGGAGIAVAGAVKTSIDGINSLNKAPVSGGSWYETMGTDFKALAKVIRPAGKKIGEFKESYVKSKQIINETFGPHSAEDVGPSRPSNDYLKLVAAKDDFDREIQPFLDIPEAKRYKRQMELFISTSEARNNIIMEHDEKLNQVFRLWSDMALERAETDELSAKLKYDFELAEVTNFMDRALQRIKWDLTRTVNSLAKTIEYMGQRSVAIQVNDSTVDSIAASLAEVQSEYGRMMEDLASGTIPSLGIEVRLKELLTPKQREALVRGEVAVFSIRPKGKDDPFKHRYSVTTRKVSLARVPALSQKGYTVLLEHLGNSILKDKQGKQHVYSHQPVRTLIQTNDRGGVVNQGELSDSSNNYVGVSPYGPWRIKLDISNDGDRQKIVNEAFLSFDVVSRVAMF